MTRTTFAVSSTSGNEMLSGTLTYDVPAPPPTPTPVPATSWRLGTDFPYPQLAANVEVYRQRYTRVFGDSGPQGPGTAPPSLTRGKMPELPLDCARHISWKGTHPETVYRDYFAAVRWPFYVTWWHEQDNDDVDRDGDRGDAADAAAWRAEMSKVVRALNAAKNPLCLGNGPTLTTWFLDGGGDPRQYWVDGNTHFWADRYDFNTERYRTDVELVDPIIEAAERVGAEGWGVPEFGGPRKSWDTTGNARAEAMISRLAYLKSNGAKTVGWWNQSTSVLTSGSPEEWAWRTATYLQ